ncbi:valine--tRNA ligase [Parafilimonas terrae]|uniref:Valine--tRNA ligase n=1 Tax=Parafilimonas terrae TaxID=1465490 RepID=A0A1I5WIU2_9BACT|nr:valine--tRNA ligase [Parafilimonas terrae]SFQ19296.1 valyl-tRNA synthetase [Parafilimonas terrae]
MELSKNFNHTEAEAKWYAHWMEKKYFNSVPDEREPYTIVMPPPNVTGVLHMGHALNNTIQDVLIRHARMHGKNACWVPGTDHASIATEAKVVQMLRERGITKASLSREEFLKYAWEWKEKYGGIILQQLRKLGCSADWDRTTFTMDDHYYKTVIKVFVDLYNKGLIYRGERMIHWDVKAKTALSDEEVIYRETNSKLYYVKYNIVEESGIGLHDLSSLQNEKIIIATVRPETILGDTAICVNPKDERYKHLVGKTALVPLINRRIPIIADDYVEMEFGTGALKITPAHDMNDYNIGKKYGLEVIDILNDDGTMSEAAQLFVGEDRFEARKKMVAALEEAKHIIKIEDYKNQVGYSERSDAVVEPRLSLQWWLSMKKLSDPALKAVLDETIKFFPPKYVNTYRYWMENIKDWCVSRQLWWGQRIPAWYDEEGNVYVAENEEEANRQRTSVNGKLKQDEDVLDTWFSSWLWPMEVFKGLSEPGNKDIQYYYPTQTLVTAPEIIFFWVARMIISGYEYKEEKPFSNVYFTGIVRDELGRKMSKSLGNSPDLLALIDKYGADAVRFGILISSPAGNDLLFDVKEESTLKQGSFFINKIWNAMKLVKMWEGRATANNQQSTGNFAVTWFEQRLNEAKLEIEKLYEQFKLSEALKTIYSLIWDDFCSWYLEWIKPGFEQPIEKEVHDKTIFFFNELMQLLHPFMPFVTEEIYHLLQEHEDDICVKQLAVNSQWSADVLQQGNLLKNVITTIRDARNKNNIKPKESIELFIQTASKETYTSFEEILKKQVNAASVAFTHENIAGSIVTTNEEDKFYIKGEQQADTAALKAELEKDLTYQKNFLQSVQKKLSNERFVQNAKPEVVELERKKQADAEARIKTLEESLKNLA